MQKLNLSKKLKKNNLKKSSKSLLSQKLGGTHLPNHKTMEDNLKKSAPKIPLHKHYQRSNLTQMQPSTKSIIQTNFTWLMSLQSAGGT